MTLALPDRTQNSAIDVRPRWGALATHEHLRLESADGTGHGVKITLAVTGIDRADPTAV